MNETKTENKAFLAYFDANYSRCYNYVLGYISDGKIVEDIIFKSMSEVWRAYLVDNKSLEDYNFLLDVLDSNITSSLMNLQPAAVKNIRLYKRGNDVLVSRLDVSVLPEIRRKCFLMNRVDGKTSRQIAVKLKISPRTVEKHIELAIKQLKNL